MNTKKTIPIFFSSDDNYVPFLSVAINYHHYLNNIAKQSI